MNEVTAFQKLVILSNTNFSKFQKASGYFVLYIMLYFQAICTAQNASKIVRWLRRLSLKITKSMPLCQSWNFHPLPSSEGLAFCLLTRPFLLQNFFVNMSRRWQIATRSH